MSAEPKIGDIEMVGYHFVPRGYFPCTGAQVNIATESTLFSLLSTAYGGDGRVTFGLPDFRGRAAVGDGYGPGLTPRVQGNLYGVEHIHLDVSQMPSHTHLAVADAQATTAVEGFAGTLTVNAKNGLGDTDKAEGAYWATGEVVNGLAKTPISKAYSTTSDVKMAQDAAEISGTFHGVRTAVEVDVRLEDTGGTMPIFNCQPSSVTKFVIANIGLYPTRS
ncbi:microcystin dependent MdpB family protein [Pseudoalteromonas sp. A25]|uniref:phage tail protein n=1 Tax=Pseudoalteromonas sp. A25 TaxID=116092 RepID=UPI0012610DF7|nr:tail fiber protein [Pseudoalteromonas sp. A25]BBN80755.1 microcystin dependent MdpB family protein [Pseudoalteromonas sp. A25]